MRALVILPAVLAAACGSVPDLGRCSRSTDCAAGTYCARTPDGNVCWPDPNAPTVSDLTVSCDSDPCLRGSVLHVEASVADDAEVLGAEVALDFGGTVAMSRSGGKWVADVSLREFPFDYVEHAVTVTVTGRDGARNDQSVDADAIIVTRIAWEKELDPGTALTSPVVMDDGTVAVAGANHKIYLMAWDGEGLESVSVGTLAITAAPLASGASVWIGSEDHKVYEVKVGDGSWEAIERANTGGAIRGSLSLAENRVLAASQSGFIYAVTSEGYKNSSPGFATSLGCIVDPTGSIFLVSAGMLRKFSLIAGAPIVDPSFVATIGASVSVPLAFSEDVIISANNGAQGFIKKANPVTGTVDLVATTTGAPSDGVVVLADASIIVPEENTTILSRWSSTGVAYFGWQTVDLGGDPRTPLVLDSSAEPFLVSTAGGAVHALRSDGTIAWTGQFGAAALQPGNIYTPPDQPPGLILSTAYFAGADGVLHAVIVDGALDESAPWPKAFHDAQNTNRARPQP